MLTEYISELLLNFEIVINDKLINDIEFQFPECLLIIHFCFVTYLFFKLYSGVLCVSKAAKGKSNLQVRCLL